MKAFRRMAVLGILAIVASGCAAGGGHDPAPAMAKAKSPYTMTGDYVEGCECDSVCPCVFAHDVTFNDCRATVAWRIREGRYGSTDLSGINFALALTKSGKNVPKTMGAWEGVIFVSSNASAAQKNAVVDILSSNWGKAFAKVDVRSESVEFRKEGERNDVRIGKIASMKTTPLQGSGGKPPTITNATFSLVPVMYCATTTENSYDDGAGVKWDFKGRNSFFGTFDYHAD